MSYSRNTKMLLVSLLYFAEGIPYGFVYGTLSIYFRTLGMDLSEIGILSLVGLAWTLKVLWSPLVDRFGRRFCWIVPAQIVIAVCIIVMGFVRTDGFLVWPIIIILCLASATQDIAIDAYTIDVLDKEEFGIAGGFRTGAYRIAILAGGGGLVAVSGYTGWAGSFVAIAVILCAMSTAILLFPMFKAQRVHTAKHDSWHAWVDPVKDILRLPHVFIIVVFVLTYKLGDALMASMVSPFWVDKGLSRLEMGFLSSASGMGMTILGAMAGGWFTSRFGFMKGLWVLGSLQAVSNLGYAVSAIPGVNHYAVFGASAFESFASGLGSSAFMAFLMRLCRKEYSASHYAIFSALFGFTRSIAGFIGGFGAENMGYAPFFAFTFIMAVPAFVLLPWIKKALVFRDAEAD